MISTAHAISSSSDSLIGGQAYDLQDVIRVSIALVVLMAGMLSVFFIVWGWVMLILSGGKEDKVKPATNSIRYSVVGLIVIIISLFIAPKVGDLVGLNVSKYISPQVVFSTIKDLSNKLFGNKDDINFDSNSSGESWTLPSDFSNL
jgi:Type IV secretion system pilin